MSTPAGDGGSPGIKLTPVDFDPFADVGGEPVTVPLSDAQREIWLAVQMGPDASCAYNLCFALRLTGPVSPDDLRPLVQRLFDRHEALRTTFDPSGEWQVVRPAAAIEMPLADISGLSAAERRAALDGILREEVETPLDLAVGPTARVRLVIESPGQCVLLLTAHHIVFDGWSAWIFFRELAALHSAARSGNAPALPPAKAFSDFLRRAGSSEAGEAAARSQSYWLGRFDGSVPTLDVPPDQARPPVKTYRGGMESIRLDATLSASIKRAAGQQGATIVGFLYAAFEVLLRRLSGQTDVVVGLPISVRDVADREALVGHATHLLPVRIRCEGQASFVEHLRSVMTALLDAQEHQSISFGALVQQLNLPWDRSRIPLVAATFNVDRGRVPPEFAAATAEIFMPPRRHLIFELEMNVADTGPEFIVECSYNSDLYTRESVRRWLGHYSVLLARVVADPELGIDSLSLLSDAERRQLEVEWNATDAGFALDARMQDLFEAQAARTPDRVAARAGASALSYAELDAQANRLARVLRARGVGRGQRVGLCVERGTGMLAAVLGILKAGAAYVPLDPGFPQERLSFMVEDAQLALLVSTGALAAPFGLPPERALLLDTDAGIIAAAEATRLPADDVRDAAAEDPAYVIYTSGSTGRPKGVVVPHRAVVNFLTSMAQAPGLAANDVLVAVTTLSFDIAVLELQLPLTLGATVVIASRDEAMDGQVLRGLLERHRATMMQATPVTWRLLLDAGWTGARGFKALVGGEALPKDLADALLGLGVELWNMYGPTETTVWSTCARVTGTSDGISIGKPIANTTIYILDPNGNLCPVGIPGELCIGGAGVTSGYWLRPELTAERFVPDQFGATAGARLYRTGDRARWRSDGTLEHMGRLDNQVKVRGFRVELGEIEAALTEHPDVRQAAVHLWNAKAGDLRIVACCVPVRAGALAPVSLRKHLRARLPEYMVPQHFLPVTELATLPNGKVDRRRLPTPVATESQFGRQEAPADAVESAVAEIWTRLIQPARPVGRTDNFFELGGHSLLGLQALRQIEQQLGVRLEFRLLMQENLLEISRRCRPGTAAG